MRFIPVWLLLLFFLLGGGITPTNGQSIILLSRKQPLSEQINKENCIYLVRGSFNLKQRSPKIWLCELVENDTLRLYTNRRPIVLISGQRIWIPQGCVLLDKNNKVISRESIYCASKDVEVIIASKRRKKVRYSTSGIVTIPQSCTLRFEKGKFSDAVIIGKETVIEAGDTGIFEDVEVKGTWNCPEVFSSWFNDINEPNRLINLFCLTSDEAFNIMHIKKGLYYINHSYYDDTPFMPRSLTRIILDGTVIETSNMLAEYYTVFLKNVHDVSIEGNGAIIGDKKSHSPSVAGEKGHGIAIQNSCNVIIKDITIRDCWGDCIYVGFSATNRNICIDGCLIENGRRTGIAVVNVDRIEIKNCTITGIEGTPTEYGIDIEPNANPSHICKNGQIENNHFNTKYGLYVQSQETNSTSNIVVKDNQFICSKVAVTLSGGEGVKLVRNKMDSDVALFYIRIGDTDLGSIIDSNTINGTIRGNVRGQQFINNTINGICYFEDGCEDVFFANNHCKGLVNFAKGAGGNIIKENLFEYPLDVRAKSTIENNEFNDVISLTDCVFKNNHLNIYNPKMDRQNVIINLDNCWFEKNTVNIDMNDQNHIKSIFGLYNKPSVVKDNFIDGGKMVMPMLDADVKIKRLSSFSNNRFDGDKKDF